MSMAMTYDHSSNTTCGYLGFQSNIGTNGARPSPGDRLMAFLRVMKDKAGNPMLLPALAAGLWLEHLHDDNNKSAVKLREIQFDIGLVGSYLRSTKILNPQPTEFDAMHRKIVSQHAFMTNGMSEFITDLVPSTKKAMEALQSFRNSQQVQQRTNHQIQPQGQQDTSALEAMEELEAYINHMHFQARVELQHHGRMLSRINVYLQVVSRRYC